jgi:hypothetical protein
MPEVKTNMFSLMSYDAVWTLALAMHAVKADGGSIYNASAVHLAAREVDFEGASGDVRFDDNLDRQGNFDIVMPKVDMFEKVGGWDGNSRAVATSELLQLNEYRPCAVTDDLQWLPVVFILIGVLFFAGAACWIAQRVATSRNGHFSTFISHSKNDSGAEAQALQTQFDEVLLKSSCLIPTARG